MKYLIYFLMTWAIGFSVIAEESTSQTQDNTSSQSGTTPQDDIAYQSGTAPPGEPASVTPEETIPEGESIPPNILTFEEEQQDPIGDYLTDYDAYTINYGIRTEITEQEKSEPEPRETEATGGTDGSGSATGTNTENTTTGNSSGTTDPAAITENAETSSAGETQDVIPVEEETSDPQTRVDRSVKIYLNNLTDMKLTRYDYSNSGSFHELPYEIPPRTTGIIWAYSDTIFNGTEGVVRYKTDDGQTMALHWNNPYFGSNAYSLQASVLGHKLAYYGGSGNDAVISAFFTPDPPPMVYKAIISADTQAWRLKTGDPNSSANKAPWEKANNLVVDKINGLAVNDPKTAFQIINGDLTEFGRNSTWDSFRNVYNRLKIPYLYGLGNHDYANNVGDCTDGVNLSTNACARNSVDFMASELGDYGWAFPYIFSPDWDHNAQSGSLAYSWDYGYFHFIQLQNFPTYKVNLTHYTNAAYDVLSSMTWLENDLKRAKGRDKIPIILMHDYNDHFAKESTAAEKTKFTQLLNTYNVRAIFGGHTHVAAILNENGGDALFGNTVVYNSGALFNGDFLRVDFVYNCLQVHQYNLNNNDVISRGRLCTNGFAGSGTYDKPKTWGMTTNPGLIHKGGDGYWEARFAGTATDTNKWYFPVKGQNNAYWFWRGENAGTNRDPKDWGQITYPGALHKGSDGYWEARFTGTATDTNMWYYPAKGQNNAYWFWRGEHAGTFTDPKSWGEPTSVGSIHKNSDGYWEARFSGTPTDANKFYFPAQGKDNQYWYWRGVHAGTYADPKPWGEPTVVGTLHKNSDGYWESRFTGTATDTNKWYYPAKGLSNDYWLWKGEKPPQTQIKNYYMVTAGKEADACLSMGTNNQVVFGSCSATTVYALKDINGYYLIYPSYADRSRCLRTYYGHASTSNKVDFGSCPQAGSTDWISYRFWKFSKEGDYGTLINKYKEEGDGNLLCLRSSSDGTIKMDVCEGQGGTDYTSYRQWRRTP